MKTLLYIFLFVVIGATSVLAQHHPQRTAEDIARKQTGMMVRELCIQDTVVMDTLYRLHLKYAHKRAISNTRAEAIQYIQDFNAELRQILTSEQYQQFMGQQINHAPHRHRTPYNRIIGAATDTISPCKHDEEAKKPLPLPVSRP